MWRIRLLMLLLTGLATLARAQGTQWQTSHGAVGPSEPVMQDCHPVEDFIDPRGRELWIRSVVEAPTES